MLRLPQRLVDAMYAHGEQTFPRECCGILLGRRHADGSREAVEAHGTSNLKAGERNDYYEMDPADRKRIEDHGRAAGLEIVGFYHSHPDHDSYFSPTDLNNCEEALWGEPWLPSTYSYPVMSIKGGRRDHWKSFVFNDGRADEEGTAVSG